MFGIVLNYDRMLDTIPNASIVPGPDALPSVE